MNYLSINDVRQFKPHQSVWVLNNTKNAPIMARNIDPDTHQLKQERADVMLVVNSVSGTGEKEVITIPQSFLPTDVTEYVALEDILNCRSFISALREGLITIIDESSAQELMNSEGASEERQRLRQLRQKVMSAGAARGITKATVTNTANPGDNDVSFDQNQHVQPLTEIEPTEEDDFDPTFIANAQRWQTMSDVQVKNEMRTVGKFTVKQLKYLQRHLDAEKHKSTLARIKTTLKK